MSQSSIGNPKMLILQHYVTLPSGFYWCLLFTIISSRLGSVVNLPGEDNRILCYDGKDYTNTFWFLSRYFSWLWNVWVFWPPFWIVRVKMKKARIFYWLGISLLKLRHFQPIWWRGLNKFYISLSVLFFITCPGSSNQKFSCLLYKPLSTLWSPFHVTLQISVGISHD